MRIPPRIPIIALASFSLMTSAFADTVVLKDGSKLEGKITSETDTQLVIETKAGGIVDEHTVAKTDVANVQKVTPDESAYAVLKSIKLSANSLPGTAQYDAYLGPLKAFVAQYPNSAYKGEVEKVVADFEAEKARVADGEVKLSGKWLGKDEVQRERYQINGALAFNYLKEQAARNDLVGALNTFDALEKQYPGSRGYVDAVDTVRRILPTLKQQADARVLRLPAEKIEREKALSGAAGLSKIELQKEYDQEKKGTEAALAQAKQQGGRWLPFLPHSEEAMKRLAELSKQEISRLNSFDSAKARQSLQLSEESRAALVKGELPVAEEKLRAAQRAWSRNESLQRLEKDLSEAKIAAVKAAEEARVAKEKAVAEAEKKAAAQVEAQKAQEVEVAEAKAEEKSKNLPFKIILGVVLGGVAFAGWKAYCSVRNKANEVLE